MKETRSINQNGTFSKYTFIEFKNSCFGTLIILLSYLLFIFSHYVINSLYFPLLFEIYPIHIKLRKEIY